MANKIDDPFEYLFLPETERCLEDRVAQRKPYRVNILDGNYVSTSSFENLKEAAYYIVYDQEKLEIAKEEGMYGFLCITKIEKDWSETYVETGDLAPYFEQFIYEDMELQEDEDGCPLYAMPDNELFDDNQVVQAALGYKTDVYCDAETETICV